MMILKENEACKLANRCPHNDIKVCYGARTDRPYTFTCAFVTDGIISDSGFRNPYDQTGKMKVIME